MEIVNENGFSFGIVTNEILKEKYISEGNFEVPICEQIFIRKKWDFINEIWIEGATPEEILQANAPIVPTTISRMKFIIQVFLTTGITYEDIVLFVQNLPIDQAQKYVIVTRLKSATHFDRNSNDLLTISAMMGITSEQLDEIFINGNLIE